jgi:diaminopimelate epimerase
MRFEKWQALGNDYLIVDAREREAPLDAELVRRLCDRHAGVGADGVLELSEAGEPGYVARVRIVNPDGSEAELSGNGVRQAVLYLRARGWTDARQFSVLTAAGEIRPTILSDTTCRVDMGRARLRSPAFPEGKADGTGELRAGGRAWRFQHVSIGNPQCAIALGTPREVEELDVTAVGAEIERSRLFPDRTNVSFFAPEPGGDAAIRVRIFDRVVGDRRMRRGRRPCAARRRLARDGAHGRRRARGRRGRRPAGRPDGLGGARLRRRGGRGRAQTLTACSRSARVSDVLRSVEARRSPMISAHGTR